MILIMKIMIIPGTADGVVVEFGPLHHMLCYHMLA